MNSIIPAKEFENKLWVLADYVHQAVYEARMSGVLEEREACAKVCEEPGWNAANWCAKAIRARGLHNMNKQAEQNGEEL
jgi:hypothetical protein